jgi:hypothetical protein
VIVSPVIRISLYSFAIVYCVAALESPQSGPGSWTFRPDADRTVVSGFFDRFDRGSLSLNIEINDGTGPSNFTDLGYLKIRNGNVVQIDLAFAKTPDSDAVTVTSMEAKPREPIEVAPGRKVVAIHVLPEKKLIIDVETTERKGVTAESLTLESSEQSDDGSPIFVYRNRRGSSSQYRVSSSGGIETRASRASNWVDLVSAGKRVQVMPIAKWPPALNDLISWLPKPVPKGNSTDAATAVAVQGRAQAVTRRPVPVPRVTVRFAGHSDHLQIGKDETGNTPEPTKATANTRPGAIDDLDVVVNGTGLLEGSTFHAGSAGELNEGTTSGTDPNTFSATFKVAFGEDKMRIPLRVKIDGSWRVAVPFYDLDSVSAAATVRAKAEGTFPLPKVEESGFMLDFQKEAHLNLDALFSMTMVRGDTYGKRQLSVQLDPKSGFTFLIPGAVRVALDPAASGLPVEVVEQTLQMDAPFLEVKGTVASEVTGTGENGIRVGAGCTVRVQSSDSIRIGPEGSGWTSGIEPGFRTTLKTGVEARLDFDGENMKVQLAPSSLEWSGHLRNTSIRHEKIDLDSPGRIVVSGRLATLNDWDFEGEGVLALEARAKLLLLDPGGTIATRFTSMPTLGGELEPGSRFEASTGGLELREKKTKPGGYEIANAARNNQSNRARSQGTISTAWGVQVNNHQPAQNLFTGRVMTNLDLETVLDFFLPKEGSDWAVDFRFAGQARIERKDTRAIPELEVIALPYRVFGEYGHPQLRAGKGGGNQ